MKILVSISLFIFFAVVTAIITAGLVFSQQNKINSPGSNNSSIGSVGNTGGNVIDKTTGNAITLDSAEVSKHSLASDCWLIVNNKVYNLTNFLSFHSGGEAAILPYCGTDGTNAFNTKDGQGSHRSGDLSILNSYYIGDLNQAVGSATVQQNIQKSNQTNPPARRGENEYGEDD